MTESTAACAAASSASRPDGGSGGILVALIGGIGSGKSTVSGMFSELGCAVISLDSIGHEVLALPEVKQDLASAFGDDVLDGRGAVVRPVLAQRAFSTAEGTQLLNSITHPRIMAIFEQRARQLSERFGIVVVEVTAGEMTRGAMPWAKAVVAVSAPSELRLERACARGQQPEDVRRRMAAQPTDAERAAAADFVIENAGDLDSLRARIAEVHAALRSSL